MSSMKELPDQVQEDEADLAGYQQLVEELGDAIEAAPQASERKPSRSFGSMVLKRHRRPALESLFTKREGMQWWSDPLLASFRRSLLGNVATTTVPSRPMRITSLCSGMDTTKFNGEVHDWIVQLAITKKYVKHGLATSSHLLVCMQSFFDWFQSGLITTVAFTTLLLWTLSLSHVRDILLELSTL